MDHKAVQAMGKVTMEYIKTVLKPGIGLKEVRRLCEKKMLELGADSFWYWNVGAFVFSGKETTLSVSGREYESSDRVLQEEDIITIDLSPQREEIWGDYARTIILEKGKVVENLDCIRNEEWKAGLQMEQKLHRELYDFVTAETTFEELFYHMNKRIIDQGYVNLDFLGNLGHSIEKRSEDRIYIEKGNQKKLREVSCFTFEPHISRENSRYGYKWENIYYLENGKLKEV